MSLLPPRKKPDVVEPEAPPELERAPESTEDRLLAVLEKFASAGSQAGFSPQQLEAILTRVGLSTAEGMRQSLKPENPEPTNISVFFTEKDLRKYGSFAEKPKLRRRTFFVGAEEKDERLTPAEIEAYNQIDGFREARGGRWRAEIRKNGQHEELFVTVPCDTVDQRMELPSLLLILHELNGGASTADLHSLIRQLEYLKGHAIKAGANAAELEKELMAL